MDTMKFMKGITFAPFHKRGSLSTETARKSFDYMIEQTAVDFVILAPAGIQKTAHSEEICYTSEAEQYPIFQIHTFSSVPPSYVN